MAPNFEENSMERMELTSSILFRSTKILNMDSGGEIKIYFKRFS